MKTGASALGRGYESGNSIDHSPNRAGEGKEVRAIHRAVELDYAIIITLIALRKFDKVY